MKIKLLVVIYNKHIENNITITSATGAAKLFSDFEIIVWDNSTDSEYRSTNECYAQEHSLIYLTNNDNAKLSWVYNKIIKEHQYDYLIISDDDSEYSEEYFNKLQSALLEGHLVSVPQIYVNDKLRSPAKMGLIVGKHLDGIESGTHKNLIAITSGMVISSKLKGIMTPIFDENLSFYGVDTEFFLRLSQHNIPLHVLNVRLTHEMAMHSEEYKLRKKDLSANFRYINNKQATIYICKKQSYFRGMLAKVYYLLYEYLKIK
ncbi:hypothetical protein A8O28_00870 [Enterobacteriaceae bacterium CCUG 67584]|nr:hypothetical protein [Enterobacteriaceae bacterium CCUG 67584]